MDKELIKLSIRKAITEGDQEFFEDLLDKFSIEYLISNFDALDGFYEYCNKDYEKAKYLASIAYLKGKKEAKIILNLLEINSLLSRDVDENAIVVFLIKNSDDIFTMAYSILRYFKYLYSINHQTPEISVINIINRSIELCPNVEKLKILKIYVMYAILGYDIDSLQDLIDSLSSDGKELVYNFII